MPRLIAVCTCSRSASARTDALVTRETTASDDNASAIAGNVKWRTSDQKPVPLPSAGNQPSFTENTEISAIAATNDGNAAEIEVVTSTLVSASPGRSAAMTPLPIPTTRMISAAYRTSPPVVDIPAAITDDTFSRMMIETPRLPCSALSSQYQYWAKNGWFKWYCASSTRTLDWGRPRPPESAEIGPPGARWSAPKMTKLATRRLASSMHSLRIRNRLRIGESRSPQVVRPRREHVRE